MEKNIKPEDIIYLGSAAYSEFRNTIIWRYMDYFKFESLLSESKLYLCRLDQFDDFYEGTLTKANQVSLSFRTKGIDEKKYINTLNKVRRWSYANSWYIGSNVSDKMFNDFGSIAIKTTSFNLQKAVSDCKIGIVKYITEQTFIPENDPYSICIHKRSSFQHENELRIVHVDNQLDSRLLEENNPLKGIKLSVDINLLIDRIYVSHLQPNYFNKVKKLCEIYSIEKPVVFK